MWTNAVSDAIHKWAMDWIYASNTKGILHTKKIILTLMLFKNHIILFIAWNTTTDVQQNVQAAIFHAMDVDSEWTKTDNQEMKIIQILRVDSR